MTDAGQDTFTRDVFAWEDQILADRGMTPLTLHVALVLRQHWNRDSGEAWPSQDLIASKLGVTARAVRAAVDQLASRGHLFVVTPKGRKNGNRYRPIVRPSEPFHRNDASGDETDNRNNGSYETAVHRNDSSGKNPFHRNEASGNKAVHRNDASGLTGTSVPPNHLIEPSEEIDSVSTPSKPKSRPRAPKPATSDAQFDAFWLQVPKAAGKADARQAYDKAILSGAVTHNEIMIGIARYATERQGEDPKFTKHPATWIRKGCWADAPSARSSSQQPTQGRRPRFDPMADVARRLQEFDHD